MSSSTIDIHTSLKGVVTSPLIDAKEQLRSAESKLSSITIPMDFSGANCILNAQNGARNAINLVDEAISQIDSSINAMEQAEQAALYQVYKQSVMLTTKDVSFDIKGYDKKDEIDQHDVLMEVIDIVGLSTWRTMSEKARKILLNAEYIHRYMEKGNYQYCVLENARGDEYGLESHKHGLNVTFEESKAGYHNVCCATYVSWVLQGAGLLNGCEHGAEDLKAKLKGEGWQVIENPDDLKPGDILGYKNHIEIYAGQDKDDNRMLYNAGSGEWIRERRHDTRENHGGEKSFVIAYRAPNDSDDDKK